MGFLKIKQHIKTFLQNTVLPIYYKICSNGHIDSRYVIFADAHSKTVPYSMKLLRQKFIDEGYRVEDIICDYGHSGFVIMFKNMFKFMRCYSKAKYVIICDYFLPVSSADKSKETIVVQLWHACGIFKKFGYDAEDDISIDYKGSPSKNFDLVTVSSPICEDVYSKAFRIPRENVKSLGISRTDLFFNQDYILKCHQEFYEQYPNAKGKKIILWTPTFRSNAGNPILVGEEYIESLNTTLGKDYYVIIRLHPHFKDHKLNNCSIPTERLLPVADLLISDYSTVIFEYALFNLPIVLFVPDFDEYYSNRGFYLDYYNLPWPMVKDGSKLADMIVSELNNTSCDNSEFLNTYMSSCDGNATIRIFNEIIRLGGDLDK